MYVLINYVLMTAIITFDYNDLTRNKFWDNIKVDLL